MAFVSDCIDKAMWVAGLTSLQHETLPEMLYGAPEGAQANPQAQDQFEVTSPESLSPLPSQRLPPSFQMHDSVLQIP